MIQKIRLENFLSYEDATAEFTGSTIAVVGDNGTGKSAFLEAIPYAYFGISREIKEGMSRIHGDGSHKVEVWEDGDVHIMRGRKPGGSGVAEVHVAGELVAKGKDADAWIVDHLGMSGDTFMMTAFFGLGESHGDRLLRVPPASRLETLQELAQVGPYKYMLKRAKELYAEAERKHETSKARKEGAEETIADEGGLKKELSDGNDTVAACEAEVKRLRNERRELQTEEEAYQAFVKEKERLSVERNSLRSDLEVTREEKDQSEETISNDKAQIEETKKELEERSRELANADVDSLRSSIEEAQRESTAKKTMLELKKVALDMPQTEANCPLCGQPVSEEIVEEWERSVNALKEQLDALHADAVEKQNEVDRIERLQADVESKDAEVKDLLEEVRKSEEVVKKAKREISQADAELRKKDDRFYALSEKLGDEYQGLLGRIQDVSDRIDAEQQRKHSTQGQIEQIKAALKKSAEAKKRIQQAKADMASARKDMEAAKVLKEAWSRYGIPLRLVNRLNRRIETRASAVYQAFDSGRIEVREVEDRGKPGVQFYLVDRKGDRTYSQLSMGEKVMFFISVRVALAQIVSEDSVVRVDYLVLDEAMGNLSPKRRDDLIRLINKTLRKMFPQVIMVSHTEMRDIFSQTLRITAENDVSCIEAA